MPPRRKQRRPRPASKRGGPGSRPPRWLLALLFAAGALAAGAGSLAWVAERMVSPLVEGRPRAQYTTRVFGAPLRLRPGTPISPGEFESRLRRLGYEKAEASPASGAYARDGGGFVVGLRTFEHPFVRPTPVTAAVRIAGGAVESLVLAEGGAPLVEAVLEPELLYELSGDRRVRRTPLAPDEIPPAMKQALVAIEDRRFYSHTGIDPRGIARAAWRNLRAQRIAEGGSTLTQQLAKNLFLTPRRTFTRKAKEAMIALYLEARYSKEDILRLYLDSVYFGQNGSVGIVGLSEASRHFFAVSSKDLSAAQCAMLAGLLRSPAGYDPFRRPERALGRRNEVLAAMRREGFLSPRQEMRAVSEPLVVTRAAQEAPRDADHFLAYIERVLAARYSDEAWMTRGMTVHTTLDSWLQERAAAAVKNAPFEAALVALDPRSGAVRALVGGRDFTKSQFDRATQARRQPGSAFKPFVFGAALRADGGRAAKTPASLLDDTTRVYRIEGGTWTPRNYDRVFHGPVTVREALARSLNAATVGLAEEIGPKEIIAYARELGIRSPLRPTLGLALGASEVSLLELTGAYAPFANGGYRIEPFAVEAAIDAEGSVLEFHNPEPRAVLSPAEAYLMTDLLREVVRSGTARRLAQWGLDAVAAGKTGTTDDGKDAWFIGYTPSILAGVWSGSDIPKALGITGASAAMPVWAAFVKAAESRGGPPAADAWPRPDSVVTAVVDPHSGMLARAGCRDRRTELFVSGTEPANPCPLHSGGPWGWLKRMFSEPREPSPGGYR